MKKILLIEEDAGMRTAVKEILGLSNYTVVCAADGKEGVRMAVGEQPDLIICDIFLSSLDGYGVMYALQQYPATRSIPVIALTSTDEPADFRKAMGAGADDYLNKPFDGTALLRSVEACLERNHQRRRGRKDTLAPRPSPTEAGVSITPWHAGDREVREVKKKEMLYSEGQRASFVFYLVSGKAKTFLVHTDGKELITRIYGPGDCIGAAAAIRGGSYSDSAQVVEDAALVNITRTEFLSILDSDSDFSRQIMQWLAHNASEQEAGLLNLAYSSLRKKVANGIIRLYDKFNTGQDGKGYVTISRENLAAIVGAAPESLTRTLSDFRKEQLIDIAEGKIHLLDEEKLREMLN
jgi:CRP/FNR family cyclic AMP-dependent transcriptional regulator